MSKEYIEREAVLQEMTSKPLPKDPQHLYLAMRGIVRKAPAADVVAVRRGEWLKTEAYPHRVYCSLCYKTYITNEEVIRGRSDGNFIYCSEAEYCPHCGAEMDLKEGD